MEFYRWLYRGGRPNALAKAMNGVSAWLHARGIWPNYMVTLEVIGRRSGRPIRFPLVLTALHGERYLVSMLGEDANWVHNLAAAGDAATLHHGTIERVRLEPVAVGERAPILKAFLRRAPGARPHIPVSPNAPIAAFEGIAARYPVFRIQARNEYVPHAPRTRS